MRTIQCDCRTVQRMALNALIETYAMVHLKCPSMNNVQDVEILLEIGHHFETEVHLNLTKYDVMSKTLEKHETN